MKKLLFLLIVILSVAGCMDKNEDISPGTKTKSVTFRGYVRNLNGVPVPDILVHVSATSSISGIANSFGVDFSDSDGLYMVERIIGSVAGGISETEWNELREANGGNLYGMVYSGNGVAYIQVQIFNGNMPTFDSLQKETIFDVPILQRP